MLLGRQLLSHVIYFVGVGFMADKGSCVELILKHSLDACAFPKVAVGNLGFVVAKLFAKCLLLLVSRAYLFGDVAAVHIVKDSLESDDKLIVLCLGIESALDIFKYFYGLVANLSPSFFYFITERRKCKYGILAFLIISRKKTA